MTATNTNADVRQDANVVDMTQATLIRAIGNGDPRAWNEADAIYRPLIRFWLGRYGLQSNDVEDLTQDVLATLVREISSFVHNGRVGAFRNWLRTTTFNIVSNALRKRAMTERIGGDDVNRLIAEVGDPNSDLSREFTLQHDRIVIQHLLARVASQCEAKTMDIFRMHMLEGVSVRETAQRLHVSEATVHTAKSRVMKKLRSIASDQQTTNMTE